MSILNLIKELESWFSYTIFLMNYQQIIGREVFEASLAIAVAVGCPNNKGSNQISTRETKKASQNDSKYNHITFPPVYSSQNDSYPLQWLIRYFS